MIDSRVVFHEVVVDPPSEPMTELLHPADASGNKIWLQGHCHEVVGQQLDKVLVIVKNGGFFENHTLGGKVQYYRMVIELVDVEGVDKGKVSREGGHSHCVVSVGGYFI